ncbi:MAG: hypothetical protein R3C44_21500 [Chloroflexota bacterium]
MSDASLTFTLCIRGTQAEFAGQQEEACALYRQAWDAAADDYDACIAAHYVARCQSTPDETLHWNEIALARAESAEDDRPHLYPSLYVNLGQAHEQLGHTAEAERFFGWRRIGAGHEENSIP